MAQKPYYTSDDLIEAVKRKMAFPIAQVTFDEQAILNFANEEMYLAQVPSIMQFHEEYLVHSLDIPLKANTSKYPIPNRAIGMKLRDVYYADDNNNLYEMTKISPDDKNYYQGGYNNGNSPYHYYLQNNSIVIAPGIGPNPVGRLAVTYYLRPNALVPNARAAIISSFSKMITVDNANLVPGQTLTINDNVITVDTDFLIGATSNATAANLDTYLNSLEDLTSTVTSNMILVQYPVLQTAFSTTSTLGLVIQESITLQSESVPDNITNGSLIDLIQTDGGHSTLALDIKLSSTAVSPTSITLDASLIPEDFVVGDYICTAYECIIPQVPSDLHNLLAERTCARILESLGDKDGLAAANAKIDRLEFSQGTILDNRVDGSPLKIVSRGLLARGRSRRIF